MGGYRLVGVNFCHQDFRLGERRDSGLLRHEFICLSEREQGVLHGRFRRAGNSENLLMQWLIKIIKVMIVATTIFVEILILNEEYRTVFERVVECVIKSNARSIGW